MNVVVACSVVLTVLHSVVCTIDLNIHEIQYIADHLPEYKCRELVASLHSEKFVLENVTDGANEPNLTCIELLVLWDQTEASDKTFHHLVLRLKQLGETELADKLSETVFHEKTLALEDTFLDDPFEELVHKDSPLLDNPAKKRIKEPPKNGVDPLGTLKLTFIVSGSVCLAIALIALMRVCCPPVISLVAPILCPAPVLDCCLSSYSCVTVCCRRVTLHSKKHLLGSGLNDDDTPLV